VVPVDPDGGGVLLVDHVNAGLWLPPGGHVEPDEHPALAARREAWEELGIDAVGRLCDRPAFLTITRTIGVDHGHTDVSLWFLLSADRTQPLVLDTAEFRSARWWSPTDVSGADPATFDPHFARFLAKVGRSANEVRAASAGRPEDGTAVAGASDQVATPT
jgi:8-oxo-dGTP pyrophosphatase MutT (NUDIX family)